MLTKFAIDALAEEHLGEGKYPDLLAVSFSATDLVGHLFGPYSQEEEDMIVRLDENIAALLDAIDHQVGLNNTIIALTSDHGVAPIPEYSRQHGLGGNRINGMELAAQWETKLEDRYGEGKYILKLINHEIYLNEKLLSEKNINIVEVEEFLGREAVKTKGIAGFFTRAQLLRGELPNTDIGRRAQAAFNARESGDLHLLVEPFTLLVESKDELTGTAHGTPYPYDTHVPIILMGPGIKAGVYRASCAPNDIAPTFAALLKIEAPSGSIGRVLTEALGE
jgi:arylsulfatase A-like enzyme